ncbi:hypothetical protein Plim_3479 [Planctopirus limnophila DSM 3776]|uniref:Uncharacterized protein n=1 Tax=Planctopirus limnophila (strain ATCC 43296 / DSM 3776 / IFAM 1008 / Mu 290) TaxID=521674 RepID=D5SV06_PLAL2|nr:hypothetical protein Plim_3479 [Planctopirus limnophila DSM 3776]
MFTEKTLGSVELQLLEAAREAFASGHNPGFGFFQLGDIKVLD